MNQKDYQSEELFFVVDDNDKPLKPLKRSEVHGHGAWHRVSHVWIFNDKGDVLCEQRSLNKELAPGRWESFLGGHLAPKESYIDGAMRELAEEIGLKLPKKDFNQEMIYKKEHKNGYNNEFQGVFSVIWGGDVDDLHFSDGEVEQVRWMPINEVLKHLESSDRTWSFCGYEIDLIKRKL